MIGISAETGAPLDGARHLEQSVRDILTTPVGSRVMRRDYGSELPRLVDAPLDGATLVRIYAASAEALERWEPRLALDRVEAVAFEAGRLTLELAGTFVATGEAFRTEVSVT